MDASGPEMVASDAVPSLESSTTSLSSVAHSVLFKLPRELRDYIYEYSFYDLYTTARNGKCAINVTKNRGIPEPAIMLTCKTVRDEALMLYYSQPRFNLMVRSFDPTVMLLWNAKKLRLRQDYNLATPGQDISRSGPKGWSNLKRTLQLIHSGHRLFVDVGPRGGPRYSEQEEFIQGMARVAWSMNRMPWDVVETTLQMLRHGLVALDSQWAK